MDKNALEILKRLKNIEANMLTKDAAKKFAAKDDLKNFATKADLKSELSRYATKQDLKNELSSYSTKADLISLEKRLETKFAAKQDLKILRSDISEDLGGIVSELVSKLDNNKAGKVAVEYLEERVKIIEQKIAA